jgi:serine/threonine protein kinase
MSNQALDNSLRQKVGKYELGRILGEGTFAKVRFAKHIETRQNVAIKIIDKEKVFREKLVEQVKQISCTLPRY